MNIDPALLASVVLLVALLALALGFYAAGGRGKR